MTSRRPAGRTRIRESRNRPQSWWTTITFAAAAAVIMTWIQSREAGTTALNLWKTGAFSFVLIGLSLRASDRLTRIVIGRFGPKPPPPPERGVAETEPRTERPSHVARRRQQRRPRGGPRKR